MAPSSYALSKYLYRTKIKNPDDLLKYKDNLKFIQNQFIDHDKSKNLPSSPS